MERPLSWRESAFQSRLFFQIIYDQISASEGDDSGMKKTIKYFLVLCVLVPGIAISKGFASDIKNSRSPVYEGVKQIYIYVDYDVTYKENYPKALRKGNIEALLLETYKGRFSAKDCKNWIGGYNPYNCEDQPVTLLKNREEYSAHHRQGDFKKPGTLNVLLQVRVIDNENFNTPAAAFYLIQDRPEPEILTEWEISTPVPLPTNLSEEIFSQYLRKYINVEVQH